MQVKKNFFEVFVFLGDPDFFVREVVEVVNEAVDPAVGGVNLALEVGLLVVRPHGIATSTLSRLTQIVEYQPTTMGLLPHLEPSYDPERSAASSANHRLSAVSHEA